MIPFLTLLAALSCVPAVDAVGVTVETINGRSTCTVTALGNEQNDVPNIKSAFSQCGNGGTIVFPMDQNYWIAERINPLLKDARIDWKGQWTMSDDLNYWRNNSYPVAFQNHAAGIVFSGKRIVINGYSTGGINGNGEAWYTAEKGVTQPGRPMPLVFWNVTDVRVNDFFVKQPPLWSVNIMNGKNMFFRNIYVNATSINAPKNANWVQNTDGFDTMDADNIWLTNFTYQGGDDCIAIKPRSTNIFLENIKCNKGNGIAIGSLGQYLEDSSVTNVIMKNLKVPFTRYGVYIKTWMGHEVPQEGYESAGVPRGGGWGVVKNVTFENVDVTSATRGLSISQNNGDNGTYAGTSKMEISDVRFKNFHGTLSNTANAFAISCSKLYPCYGLIFSDINQVSTTGVAVQGTCKWYKSGGITGLSGC